MPKSKTDSNAEFYAGKEAGEQAQKWAALQAQLDDMDLDPTTLFDTLDGETSLVEAVEKLDLILLERLAQVDGLKETIDKLTKRKSRLEKQSTTIKMVVFSAMQSANLQRLPLPSGLYSTRNTPQKLMVTDEKEIPAKYFTQPDPVLNRKELLDALKADGAEPIPGATLDNGGTTLAIRR